jgi:hypothetical protein
MVQKMRYTPNKFSALDGKSADKPLDWEGQPWAAYIQPNPLGMGQNYP